MYPGFYLVDGGKKVLNWMETIGNLHWERENGQTETFIVYNVDSVRTHNDKTSDSPMR